jgi:thiamine-phosphate pyrophosphorylase
MTNKIDRFNTIDIYPVISSEYTNGRESIDILTAICQGGAKIVQLREKNKSKLEIYELALKYREITSKYNTLLIINDHIDIALAVKADGVHLGQDDLPVNVAKELAPNLIIGSSTHNIEEAIIAKEAGADYINIGPIFQTNTKELTYKALEVEGVLEIAKVVNLPFTVMGGIKKESIPNLIKNNITKIAMITEITQSKDCKAKVQELRHLFK